MSDGATLTPESFRSAVDSMRRNNIEPVGGNYIMPAHPSALSWLVYWELGFSGFKARRKSARLRMMEKVPAWYRP